MKNLKWKQAACLPLLGCAVAAQADDQIVVTASRVEQSRDEVGQAITVIDSEEIIRRQKVDVVDLLATVPGVRFNRNGNAGNITGVSLRGAESNQTLVLIDGVRVNDVSSTGDLFDFGNLMVANIDRIEVLRGSNSLAYGSQAIGGVVNLSTARPTAGLSAFASGEYGFRDTTNLRGQLGWGHDAVAVQAGLSRFDTDGISTAAESLGATERDGFRNLTGNARLVANLGPVELDLRGYYIDSDLEYDSFFGAPADSPDEAHTKQYVGYAGATLELFDGALSNRLALTGFRTERDYESPFGNYGFVGKNWRLEYQGEARPIDGVRLVFGYEHEEPEYRYVDAFGSNRADNRTDGFYALAIVQPVEPLSLTAGVRHDDHSQFGGETTFGANGNLSLFDGATNIRAAYGEGFKAPSLYQLYDPFSGTATLVPERSKSYDIGVDQQLVEGLLTASVTLFRRTTRNFIDFDFGTFTYQNVGRTRAKGLEFELGMRPTDSLTFTAAYSYLKTRNDDPASVNFNNRLPRRAAHSISLLADKQWAFGLITGATVTHVSGSYSDPANLQPLDGYVLVDLRAAWPITDQLELFGRVENVGDEEYMTVSGYGTPGRAAYAGVRFRM